MSQSFGDAYLMERGLEPYRTPVRLTALDHMAMFIWVEHQFPEIADDWKHNAQFDIAYIRQRQFERTTGVIEQNDPRITPALFIGATRLVAQLLEQETQVQHDLIHAPARFSELDLATASLIRVNYIDWPTKN